MAAVDDRSSTVELSMPLQRSLDTRIHLRLSTRAKAITLFLTTASQDELGSAAPMGSFVYALPNVRWPHLSKAMVQASLMPLILTCFPLSIEAESK
jgi:hypothetical protein